MRKVLMIDLSFIIWGRVISFLHIRDMSALSRINKKLHYIIHHEASYQVELEAKFSKSEKGKNMKLHNREKNIVKKIGFAPETILIDQVMVYF
jgi:hypothetical protein